ncbi:protease inhibitor I42 family protein [Chloroflexota bacterium]
MNKYLKIVLITPLVLICIFVLVGVGYCTYRTVTHCDFTFNVGNNFDESVTVYFEGRKMGEIDAGQSKIFCLQNILTKTNSDLLVELKSDSGEMLFTNLYTWEELTDVLESVRGQPYWYGEEPEPDVIVTKDDMQQAISDIGIIFRQITVRSGDPFTVSLYAHLGAGMRWSYEDDTKGVVRPDSVRKLIPDAPPTPIIVGGPGKEVWKFRALDEGKVTITMTYSSMADGGIQNVNILELVVEVK